MGKAVIHSYLFDINFDTPLAGRAITGRIFNNYLDPRNSVVVNSYSVDSESDSLVIIRPVPMPSVFNLKEGLIN